jgi:hypothetical protein
MGIDRRSFGETVTDCKYSNYFNKEKTPLFPIGEQKKSLKLIPNFVLGFFLKLFKKRPIWHLKTIKKFCHPFLRRYIKKTLPLMSYRVVGLGLSRGSWVRFGYDPRKEPRSLVYSLVGITGKFPPYTA